MLRSNHLGVYAIPPTVTRKLSVSLCVFRCAASKYQICEIGSNPANCSTASVTVKVLQAAVDAIVDDFEYHIQVELEAPLHQY
jgi:hypothetical protein